MNRGAKLLLAVTVASVVFSGTVAAEQTDKKGQYAEANVSHFELDTQSGKALAGDRITVARDRGNRSTLVPRIVVDASPSDRLNENIVVFDDSSHQSQTHDRNERNNEGNSQICATIVTIANIATNP
ncbi:hypothetical protein SAMN05421858_1807 [Haladaptatus litoreus]|uniref:Uncharacterized protein n=1 Tax=Haladaptatus litoreus TaxID=553468 RepID=A0A1N6Z044_9EURY|nr:hypothetical protein [Haladaptatus litoreus]SIR20160.1 hypothetical protein SAMN05421858_1807 [Haladaptatus litoreus]